MLFDCSFPGALPSNNSQALLQTLQEQSGGLPIILALDGDEAGRQATRRLQKQLQSTGGPVVVLPPFAHAKDLGDLGPQQQGRQRAMQHIQQALLTMQKEEKHS